MFGSFGCAACSRYPLLFHFDSCNFFIYYRYYTHLFIYILYIYFLFLSFFPFGPPSTHWVVPRALFIKLVKRSCPVPVTDTLCWVSFSLAVGALYKLYYYYYYPVHHQLCSPHCCPRFSPCFSPQPLLF